MLVLQDSVVTIPCLATGFPPPTFTWATDQGNGQTTPIQLDERRSLPPMGTGDGSLTISSVAIDDSSTLICSASNSQSTSPVQAQSRLLVIGKPHPPATPIPRHMVLSTAMPVLTTPPSSSVPAAGTSVSLPCSAQPSDSGGYTIQYRWTRGHDGSLVGEDLRDEGTLSLTSINEDQSDNDEYTCTAVITKDGYDAAPLTITVGSTTVTVGGEFTHPHSYIHTLTHPSPHHITHPSISHTPHLTPQCHPSISHIPHTLHHTPPHTSLLPEPPIPPDPATQLQATDVTADSFTVNWSAPSNTGGLPIQSYAVEIRHSGSSFCPVPNPEWEVAESGIGPSLLSWTIGDSVYADMQYQFRVVVFTSVFSTTSNTSPSFTTAQAGMYYAKPSLYYA